jgi:hypothetical protein
MKIVAFGASVTAQSKNHSTGEITGYFDALCDLCKSDSRLSGLEFMRVAAGSSHFNEAGFILLDEVLRKQPDMVIFDWHTTSSEVWNQKLVDSAYEKIRASGVLFLIAIFPRMSNVKNRKIPPSINQIKKITELENVELLNFYEDQEIMSTLPDLLRDEVHTNSTGALAYAKRLCSNINRFIELRPSLDTVQTDRSSNENVRLVKVDRLLVKKKLNKFSCYIQPDGILGEVILVFEHNIGPFSPIVKVSSTSGLSLSKSIWDPYCHYTRKTFQKIFDRHIIKAETARFDISVIDEPPKYISCRHNYDFSSVDKRYLDLDTVYVIGGFFCGAQDA